MTIGAGTTSAAFLALYGALAWLLSTTGDRGFEHLHIALDASAAMLSALLAVFLWGSSHAKDRGRYRGLLMVVFVYVAISELAHALVGAEWTGSLASVEPTRQLLLPATWPPTVYFLPAALFLLPSAAGTGISRLSLAAGLGMLLAGLYGIFLSLPPYLDPGPAGISRPFLLPALPLLAMAAHDHWRRRDCDPLFTPLAGCSAMLFLADAFMLWSVSPYDKWAIIAHLGKFLAYLLAHVGMARQAVDDMLARERMEEILRQTHGQLEARVQERTKALTQAYDTFWSLLEQSPDAIAIMTCEPDSVYIAANTMYCQLSGYAREELVGERVGNLQLWEDSTQETAVRNLLLGGMPISDLQNVFRSKDGRLIPTSLSGRRIVVNGEHWLMVSRRDMTERALIQRRLVESEERWRFAIEGHGDALWDWDLTARTVYRSPRWLSLLHLPDVPTRCTLEEIEDSIVPDDLVAVRAKTRQLLKGQTDDVMGECRMQRRDGQIIWVAYRSRVMRRDAEGRVTRVLGTIRDITTRMRRRKELDAQMESLLHQGRLLALGEMASAIAHEINQPLTSICNYASACVRLLEERHDDVQQVARRIEEQALRAGQVVWRIHGFAKRGGFSREPVAVGGLVAGMLELMALDSRSQSVNFHADIPPDLPAISADRVLIEQVLLNLIRNGIQSMAGLQVKPEISLRAETDPGRGEVVIHVADRGCGLPDQIALDVFKPFFSTKPQGLGLGLSISHSIVSRHGGRFWSAVREGGGSIFSFSLPIAASVQEALLRRPEEETL